MDKLNLNLGYTSYDITIGRNLLDRAGELLGIKSRALIVTDSGVPREYAERVSRSLGGARIHTLPMGEGAKSVCVLEELLAVMAELEMNRSDCLVAVGGGVVGDLTGFAAAIYMRGIRFYNIPTTLLAMVDSSIGGKTAINLRGIKNIVGAFHQPSGVLIDADALGTLDGRHISAGLCEAVKMALSSNAELFGYFESTDKATALENIEYIIAEALKIKREVVMLDEKESGLRKILNLGHTIGHGIEAEMEGKLYHGECVALGLLPVCKEELRPRIRAVLKKLSLPTEYTGNIERAMEFVAHDKKSGSCGIDVILVSEVGRVTVEKMTLAEIRELAISAYSK